MVQVDPKRHGWGWRFSPQKSWDSTWAGVFWPKILLWAQLFQNLPRVVGDPGVPSLGWEWGGEEEPSWMMGQHVEVERKGT